ncbi:ketoacyl-ACP synthase III [Paenibacillus sp. HN-1]|uniref:ketoacyl-ACP synthase III n=1 Tax=Paenibacillus TaxID=44249 RepID=UPI001CA91B66|nr:MULTISPECIES: ketoacyl-ACP synthase III [Paenibacillus]MBY9078479.1 ketoacyl-ACP synthase III [Paenibacillus sp. CGMCC 1.18879]MBY9082772.1 ketoacyl-ACP synthase III [Paenibacillus sinensis]
MDTPISILQAAYYHPDQVVHNDYYFEHFDRQGKDIRNFLAAMGRKNRYVADRAEENALTMGVKAAEQALKDSGLSGEDIDMFVFATQTPEYTYPTNALLLHNRLGGKHRAITMDSNANCAGMVTAVEQSSRYMHSNPKVRYALIVGCDFSTVNCNPEDEITYANFGDAAAAVILERGGQGQGLIDSLYYTDSDIHESITFPACGLSNVYRSDVRPEDIYIRWLPFDGTVCVNAAIDDIKDLVSRNGLKLDDISAFCLSQFSLKNIELIRDGLGQSGEKFIYVGDEFGYTATSSPFIAFQRGVEQGNIKRGDYLIFWSVGAGWQIPTMLLRY